MHLPLGLLTARSGARRYRLVWLVVLPLAAWAIVRGFGLDGDTDLAPLMAFTPWVAIAGLFALGLALALKNWAAATVAAVSFAILAAMVLPRAFGGGEEPPPGSARLTVLSANVYRGNADARALVDLVRRVRPDVLALQEIRRGFIRRLRRAGIERLLPRASLLIRAEDIPGGRPGIGVYSRLPIHPLPRQSHSSALPFEVSLPGGERVRMVDFHPLTPSVGQVPRWGDALEELPSAEGGEQTVLVGDFNATLDQSALRDVIDRGYRDAGEVTGSGLEMTWPNDSSLGPLVTIDHVLADQRLGIAGYGVEDLEGSDHRAIWAEVFLWPRG